MVNQQNSEEVADLMFGTVRTLKEICLQLIDKGSVNRELLLADLFQAQVEMMADAPRSLAIAVPAALYAELGGEPVKPQR